MSGVCTPGSQKAASFHRRSPERHPETVDSEQAASLGDDNPFYKYVCHSPEDGCKSPHNQSSQSTLLQNHPRERLGCLPRRPWICIAFRSAVFHNSSELRFRLHSPHTGPHDMEVDRYVLHKEEAHRKFHHSSIRSHNRYPGNASLKSSDHRNSPALVP